MKILATCILTIIYSVVLFGAYKMFGFESAILAGIIIFLVNQVVSEK